MIDHVLTLFAESYAELFGDPEQPLTAASRLADLNIESLDFIEISMRIEDEFDLELDSADFSDVETVGDVLRIFERLLAERQGRKDALGV